MQINTQQSSEYIINSTISYIFIIVVQVDSKYIQNLGPGLASLEVPLPKWSGKGPRWVRCEASVPKVYHKSSNGVAIEYQEVHDELLEEEPSSKIN